jgi:hypothetical protein
MKLLNTVADVTRSAAIRLGKEKTTSASIRATMLLEGDFGLTHTGQITFGGEAATNLPTEPVKAGLEAGVTKAKEAAGSGRLSIRFEIEAEAL